MMDFFVSHSLNNISLSFYLYFFHRVIRNKNNRLLVWLLVEVSIGAFRRNDERPRESWKFHYPNIYLYIYDEKPTYAILVWSLILWNKLWVLSNGLILANIQSRMPFMEEMRLNNHKFCPGCYRLVWMAVDQNKLLLTLFWHQIFTVSLITPTAFLKHEITWVPGVFS